MSIERVLEFTSHGENKHMKRLVNREMQIKTTRRYHFILNMIGKKGRKCGGRERESNRERQRDRERN